MTSQAVSHPFPWRIAGASFLVVLGAHVLVRGALGLLGLDRPPGLRVDLAIAAVLAAGFGVWVARQARRHGEQAHPVRASAAALVLLFVLARLAEAAKGFLQPG